MAEIAGVYRNEKLWERKAHGLEKFWILGRTEKSHTY